MKELIQILKVGFCFLFLILSVVIGITIPVLPYVLYKIFDNPYYFLLYIVIAPIYIGHSLLSSSNADPVS